MNKRDSEREQKGVNDTQYLKRIGSSYNSYNSNATNYEKSSKSSHSRRDITSILNNTQNMYKDSKETNQVNNFDSNDDIISFEGQSLMKVKGLIGMTNRSLMNLKKKKPFFQKMDQPSHKEPHKKNILTNSMIVSNFIETPNKRNDYKFPDFMAQPNRMSLISQNSMRFPGSNIKKSPESSFLISRKNLSPIQIQENSFLKVNLSKIPSDTGGVK